MFDLDFDLDNLGDFSNDLVDGAVKATIALGEKVIEVAKEELPHLAHKAGEVIEEVINKTK